MSNGPGTELPATVLLPPQTAFQLGSQSLNQVTSALSTQPLLLVIVVLNIVFASIGGFFLLKLESYRAANLTALIELMRSCVLETAPLSAQTRGANDELDHLRREIDQLRRERPTPPPGGTP